MKANSLFILLWFLFCQHAFSQLSDQEIIALKTGKKKDDSSFIYQLPFEKGKSYLFVQGANSGMSHRNELSFDFKMKNGSGICAVRDGIAIAVREDSDKGGLKGEYLSQGNHIIIQHIDGSTAHYWHLQFNSVLVEVGDTVKMGQLIGYSGNTGYSAFPHLHFQLFDSGGREILPRFSTNRGVKYLRPGRWYKRT